VGIVRFVRCRRVKDRKEKIDDAGLEIPVIGASGSLAKAGQDHQREQLDQLKRYGEIAQGLEAPYIRVFGGPIPEGQTIEECVKWDL
jgi:sugar phosphate isomerase/epimerase